METLGGFPYLPAFRLRWAKPSFAIAILLIMAAMGCQASQPPDSISESTLPIVGGTEAEACQWPSAVMLMGSLVCSGTLVHPRAVVTAKHCVMDESETNLRIPGSVGFGESRKQWAKTVRVSRCYVHPANDIGLCILAEDVTDVPIVPVMAPCEATELRPGSPIVEVGFGVIGATDKTYGTKKWINGTIESRSASLVDILVTTGSQDGEYFGDSGGPLFFRMPDQTWRLAGEDCCSEDIGDAGPRISSYTSVPYHVPWMEEASGLDLTPCHDPGGWNPDARCTGFPTNPGAGVGTWATLCQGESVARGQTCAASTYDAGPKDDGSQDVAAGDARTRDVSNDIPLADGFGFIADSQDAGPDGLEAGEPVTGGDAAGPTADTPRGPREPADSAIAMDGPQIPPDAGVTGPDTNPRDAQTARTDSTAVIDGRVFADPALSDAGRPSTDGANDRGGLIIRRTGCACRLGTSRSAEGWPLLVSFGLVGAAGRLLRRRRDR